MRYVVLAISLLALVTTLLIQQIISGGACISQVSRNLLR